MLIHKVVEQWETGRLFSFRRSVSGLSGRLAKDCHVFLLMDKNGSRSVASHLGAGRRGVGSSTEDQVAPRPRIAKNEGLPQFLIQE